MSGPGWLGGGRLAWKALAVLGLEGSLGQPGVSSMSRCLAGKLGRPGSTALGRPGEPGLGRPKLSRSGRGYSAAGQWRLLPRLLLLFCLFVGTALAEEGLPCDFAQAPGFFEQATPQTLTPAQREALPHCATSLKNLPATKRLYSLASAIRGGGCGGAGSLTRLTSFHLALLQAALSPTKPSPALAKRAAELGRYLEYWGYQSLGNFILYRDFIREAAAARTGLERYFSALPDAASGSAADLAQAAINEFLFWAAGEVDLIRELPPLSRLIASANFTEDALRGFIYEHSPGRAELSLALRTALLAQRPPSTLKILLDLGARINEGYESALFYALENYENVKFLLGRGAEVNYANAFGKSALFYAARLGDGQLVGLLLGQGAEANAKFISANQKLALGPGLPFFMDLCALEHTGKTVLMHAAANSSEEILRMLLAAGARIDAVDELGFNALDFALAAGREGNARALRELGLKTQIPTKE